jgi:hypothetical protein
MWFMMTGLALGAISKIPVSLSIHHYLRFCMGMTIEFPTQFIRSSCPHAHGVMYLSYTRPEATPH